MAQSGGQDQGKDNTYFILWVIFLIVLISGAIWFVASYQLKIAFIYIKLAELYVIQFLVSFLPTNIIPPEWFDVQNLIAQATDDLGIVQQLTPENINIDVVEYVSNRVGFYIYYPLSAIMLGLGLYYYATHVHSRLKQRYNMKSLLESQKGIWPAIKVISNVDLLTEDLDAGPWAMGQTPMQFAKQNKLLSVGYAEKIGTGFSKMAQAEYKAILNRAKAERAFAAQLGRAWRGVEAMPPYRRAIFAAFAGRGGRDTKGSQNLVSQLASSAATGKLDCTGADEMWKKHYKLKAIQDICNTHAYEFTVFISMILFAREDGVLPSSHFLWLKPMDRRLFYVINNVGRQTPLAEVGGVFAHWYTETALKRALSVPYVIDAVNALDLALSEIIYVPDEAEIQRIKKTAEEQQQQPTE